MHSITCLDCDFSVVQLFSLKVCPRCSSSDLSVNRLQDNPLLRREYIQMFLYDC